MGEIKQSDGCGVLPSEARLREKQEVIAVDLDGTLAEKVEGEYDPCVIGKPVLAMVKRVRVWLSEGKKVVVFTARAYPGDTDKRRSEAILAKEAIRSWCMCVFGMALDVTCEKTPEMVEIWDDRAVAVETNTGNFSRWDEYKADDPVGVILDG